MVPGHGGALSRIVHDRASWWANAAVVKYRKILSINILYLPLAGRRLAGAPGLSNPWNLQGFLYKSDHDVQPP